MYTQKNLVGHNLKMYKEKKKKAIEKFIVYVQRES